MFATIRDALELIGVDRRRKLYAVGLLAVVVSGLEAIAALFVLVLMRLVLEPGQIPRIPLFGDLSRFFPNAPFSELVLWFAIAFVVFLLLRSSAVLLQQYAIGRVAENTGVLLADRLFEGYLSMPYEFHLSRNSAELIRNAYDDVMQIVGLVVAPLARVFSEAVLVGALVAVLLVVSPVATVAVTLLMLGVTTAMFAVVQPRLRALGQVRQQAASSAMQHLQQGLGGLRDVKVLGQELAFAASFRQARSAMAHSEYLRATFAYVPRVSVELGFMGFISAALVIAAFQDRLESILATAGLFAYAGLRLMPSLQKIATSLNNLRFAQAAVDDLRVDMVELDTSASTRRELDDDPTPLSLREGLIFDSVSYRYSGADTNALTNVNLEIRPGESIGICGPTGGGKTTLLDLLCGLLPASEGRVLIDGKDLATHVRAWHRSLGVVHQSSFLVDDTLARNIAFGIDEDDINLDSLATAIEVAQLKDVVSALPDGIDTVVGERGVRLSGGQRQRVTLARAIYRRPQLLVLDEGTSALDTETEASIIHGLARLPGAMTLVMVAHRLASIRNCDRLFFVEEGRISGVGTYEQLQSTNDSFRAMVV